MVVKINLLQKVILHYGKRSLFWSLIIFPYLSFTTVRGQKNWFQQLWKYKFFKHRKLPIIICLRETHIQLQWENIFSLHLFLLFLLQLNLFPLRLRHQRSANKICPDALAPSFTGNLTLWCANTKQTIILVLPWKQIFSCLMQNMTSSTSKKISCPVTYGKGVGRGVWG